MAGSVARLAGGVGFAMASELPVSTAAEAAASVRGVASAGVAVVC